MILCQNCGREVEDGRSVCPHCGQPVAAAGVSAGAAGVALQTTPRDEREGEGGSFGGEAERSRTATAPTFGERKADDDGGPRRAIFAAVGVLGLLLLGGLAYYATRPSPAPGERRLENAVRPGTPEFEQIKERLVVDFEPDGDATIGGNALGNYVVTMNPKVRNFTGRTVNGLEFRAAGLSLSGETIRELVFVSEREIGPNDVGTPAIGVNFPGDRRPAQLKLELTGVRFRQ